MGKGECFGAVSEGNRAAAKGVDCYVDEGEGSDKWELAVAFRFVGEADGKEEPSHVWERVEKEFAPAELVDCADCGESKSGVGISRGEMLEGKGGRGILHEIGEASAEGEEESLEEVLSLF